MRERLAAVGLRRNGKSGHGENGKALDTPATDTEDTRQTSRMPATDKTSMLRGGNFES